MDAKQILDAIQNDNIGSIVFRYSQGRDSTVGGSGYSGVCEGMCYNFVRVKLFQPNADFIPSTPLAAFRSKRESGDAGGGVFVKDPLKPSPVDLTAREMPGERQAAGGVRFSQAVRNLDAKFKKPLSDQAKAIITDSFLTANDPYATSPLSQYTANLYKERDKIASHIAERDHVAEEVALRDLMHSHLAPLLLRDKINETVIASGDIPIRDLVFENKEKQTPEYLGQLFASELEEFIKSQNPPLRVLAICDVAKQESGHAIAFEACNPHGPISVLDPNFGLVTYQIWEKFRQGLGKMWKLYQLTYDRYTLRRYRCLNPHKERDS